MAKIEIYQGEVEMGDDDALWYWRMKDNNGEIIAQGQGYTTAEHAQAGVDNVCHEFVKIAFTQTLIEAGLSGHVPTERIE